MSWTVKLTFTEGVKSFTIQRNGFSLNEKVGAKGRHATQSASISIRSTEANRLLMVEPKRTIPAQVLNGDQVVFSGVVRPYLTYSSLGASENPLNIQVLDSTELLHVTAGQSYAWRDLTASQIVDRLLSVAKVSTSVSFSDGFPTDTRDWFPVGSDEYIDEVLGDFLWELGYDYRFTASGMEVIPTASEQTYGNIADIRGTLAITRTDETADGVDVTFNAVHIARGQKLFSMSKAFSDDVGTSYSVKRTHNGLFYVSENGESEMHDGQSILPDGYGWAKYDLSNLGENARVLSVDISDAKATYNKGLTYWGVGSVNYGPIQVLGQRLDAVRFCFPYSGQFVSTNYGEDQYRGWLFGAEITGDILYLSTGNTAFRSEGSRNASKYELKYAYKNEEAVQFAQREARRLRTAVFKYTFTSMTPYVVGGFYGLYDVNNEIQSTVRITERKYDGELFYRYTAEGAGEVEVSDIKASTGSSSQEAALQGFSVKADSYTVGDSSINLTAEGPVLQIPGVSLSWILNGQQIGYGTTMTVSPDSFTSGENEVACQAVLDSEVIAADSVIITASQNAESVEIEYALGMDPNTPPLGEMFWEGEQMMWEGAPMSWDDGVWSIEAPTPERGQYLWMRTRRA